MTNTQYKGTIRIIPWCLLINPQEDETQVLASSSEIQFLILHTNTASAANGYFLSFNRH